MYFNKIIPELSVTNLEKSLSFYKTVGFKIEYERYRQDNKLLGNREFLVQDPDGYLLRFSEDLGVKEKFND